MSPHVGNPLNKWLQPIWETKPTLRWIINSKLRALVNLHDQEVFWTSTFLWPGPWCKLTLAIVNPKNSKKVLPHARMPNFEASQRSYKIYHHDVRKFQNVGAVVFGVVCARCCSHSVRCHATCWYGCSWC